MAMLGMVFLAPHVAIPLAYLAGLLPALGAALVDRLLAPRLGLVARVLACGAFGLLASPILIMGLVRDPSMSVFFGVPGVVAAVICSLLSGRYRPARCKDVQTPLSPGR